MLILVAVETKVEVVMVALGSWQPSARVASTKVLVTMEVVVANSLVAWAALALERVPVQAQADDVNENKQKSHRQTIFM